VPNGRRLVLFCARGRAEGGCRVRRLHPELPGEIREGGVRTPCDFLGHLTLAVACELQSSEAFGCLRHSGCGPAHRHTNFNDFLAAPLSERLYSVKLRIKRAMHNNFAWVRTLRVEKSACTTQIRRAYRRDSRTGPRKKLPTCGLT
jgi:hypothetical protein